MHKDYKAKVKYIDIESIIPNDENEKEHPEAQVNAIAASIVKRGFLQPIVVDKSLMIMVGHGRYLGAKKVGLKELPCIIAEHLTESEVDAYRIADNKLNETAWNFANLKTTMEKLQALNFSLDDTAFSINDQNKILEWTPGQNVKQEEGKGVADYKESHETTDIRQIILIMGSEDYEMLIPKLMDLQTEMQVENNTEVLKRLVAAYENSAR